MRTSHRLFAADGYPSVRPTGRRPTHVGRSAVNVALYTQPDANALEAGAAVDERLENLARFFPDDLEYAVSYDTTRYVSTAIMQVVRSMIIAGIVFLAYPNCNKPFVIKINKSNYQLEQF